MEKEAKAVNRRQDTDNRNFIERHNEEIVTTFESLNTGGKIRFLSDLLENEAKILNIDRDESGNVRFVVKNDNCIKSK